MGDPTRWRRPCAHRQKLRMSVLKASNIVGKIRCPPSGPQIAVTLRASLIPRRQKIHPSAMFHMAGRALQFRNSRRMMRRSVMASQASTLFGLRRKDACFFHVASCAFLLDHRMRPAQSPARVHSRVPRKSVPRNPAQRQHWQKQAQPQFHTLFRRRPLEIIEVDPLRDLLGCACPCHRL